MRARARHLVGGPTVAVALCALCVLCASCASVETGVVTTFAGKPYALGNVDGTGADARFESPQGLAIDGAGNLYTADVFANTIRKITPAAVVTTLAGTPGVSGGADGTGPDASFNGPGPIAADHDGNVYVADDDVGRIRKITPAGVVTTYAGASGPGYVDGPIAEAKFVGIGGLAVDGAGNLYVSSGDLIRKITAGTTVSTLAGNVLMPGAGSADGTGTAASFRSPKGLAVDGQGTVFVADSGNSTIRRITADGVATTLAGTALGNGSADGTGPAAQFQFPNSVAVDGAGTVYVGDWNNATIRRITPAGVVTTWAGLAGFEDTVDGTGAAARFDDISGEAIDAHGTLFVSDFESAAIRKVV